MTSRRALIVVAALLAIVALAWIAWPRAGDVDSAGESSGHATRALADTTEPAPLAAAGREVRAAAGDDRQPEEGAGPGALDETASRALEVELQEVEAASARKTANDVLEIVVVGRTSLDGLTCTIEPLDEGGTAPGPVGPPVRDGLVFRVAHVPAGAWRVRVVGPLGAERAWRVVVPQAEDGNHRQVVVFGTASLHGTLYGFDGQPLAGHLVAISPNGPWTQLGNPECVIVTTDAAGMYRADELHSGGFRVQGVLKGPGVPGGPTREDLVRLEAGASLRRDLGRPTPDLRFTLRLTRASGTVSTLRPSGPPRDVFFDEPTEDARALGRFSGHASPGTYQILATGKGALLRSWSATIEVVTDGQEFRLTIPGVAVDGRVIAEGASSAARAGAVGIDRCRVFLIDAKDDRLAGKGITPEVGGSFHFEAVPAGRYTVLVDRSRAGGDERAADEVSEQIDVPADRDVTGLELRLPAR